MINTEELNRLQDLLDDFSNEDLASALIPIAAKAAARADFENDGECEFYKAADNFRISYEAELDEIERAGDADAGLASLLRAAIAEQYGKPDSDD